MVRHVVAVCAVWALSSPASSGYAQAAPVPAETRPGRAPKLETTPDSERAANEQAAREAFERGRTFYDSGAFEEASIAFEEAYRLSGRDALLYNVYLAYRDANEQEKAAEALRAYLAKVPNIENRAQLEARLSALEQGLARERARREAEARAQAAPVSPPPIAPAAQPARADASPKEHARPRFIAGVALAGVGVAMLASSIATGVLATKRQQKLEDNCKNRQCDPNLKDTLDSGKRLAHTTDALLFGGLAVAGTGAVLLMLDWRGRRAERAGELLPLRAACSRQGCQAQAILRF